MLRKPVSNIKWRPRVGENQLKMASIEQLNKNIETKLRLIKFTQEQAEKSLESKNVLAITRQIKTLTAKVSEVHEIQELKLGKGENIEDIQTWNYDVENKLFAVEAQIAELDNSLKRINQMAMEAEKLKEDEMAAISRQKKFEDELKLEKAKLEQRIKYEKKARRKSKACNLEHKQYYKVTQVGDI